MCIRDRYSHLRSNSFHDGNGLLQWSQRACHDSCSSGRSGDRGKRHNGRGYGGSQGRWGDVYKRQDHITSLLFILPVTIFCDSICLIFSFRTVSPFLGIWKNDGVNVGDRSLFSFKICVYYACNDTRRKRGLTYA